jgi:apolipoprotein N-acyltransferase
MMKMQPRVFTELTEGGLVSHSKVTMTENPKIQFMVRCGLAMIAGLIYAAAYPPLGWGFLVVPGIIGLLLALRSQHGTRARTLGFVHGMTAYGVSLSWLWNLFGGMAVILWCMLAVFTALFAEMQSRATERGVTGWKWIAFTCLNWGAWEFIRAELFAAKMPWMTAGLAMGPNTLLPWVGVYGVSLVVVLCAVLMASRKWKSAALIIVVLVAAIYDNPRHPTPQENNSLTVMVAGIQLEGVSLNEYLEDSQKLPPEIRYVVWPEYAIPYDIRQYKRDWNLVQELCRERDITLTFGTQFRPGGGDVWRNIALTVDSSGVRGEHTKVHTVHYFDDGTAGEVSLPVTTIHGKVGTPICFDCDYEGVVREMTSAGAEWFVVPTMDAKSWSARQHDQHAELARIRACENGRWMFVCATSGVSQVIDPNGHLHSRLDALQQGTISGSIKKESGLTFYTKFGWLTPWCMLVVTLGCWVLLIVPRKWVMKSLPNNHVDL